MSLLEVTKDKAPGRLSYQEPCGVSFGGVRDSEMLDIYGAEGETRTRTDLRPLDPEPSASTNSATSADTIGLIYLI